MPENNGQLPHHCERWYVNNNREANGQERRGQKCQDHKQWNVIRSNQKRKESTEGRYKPKINISCQGEGEDIPNPRENIIIREIEVEQRLVRPGQLSILQTSRNWKKH